MWPEPARDRVTVWLEKMKIQGVFQSSDAVHRRKQLSELRAKESYLSLRSSLSLLRQAWAAGWAQPFHPRGP